MNSLYFFIYTNYFLKNTSHGMKSDKTCRTLGLVRMSIRHLIHNTYAPCQRSLKFGPVQNVHECIWFMGQIVLDRAKYQGPFDVDQISPRTFWIGPDMTNYQGPFGINQIFCGNFEQDNMVLKWSFLLFQQIFIELFLCAK